MARVLLWAVIGVVVWWWVRRLAAPRDGRGASAPDSTSSSAVRKAADAGTPLQDMVRCTRCGVFLPRAEALPGPEGQAFCCAEHRLPGNPP